MKRRKVGHRDHWASWAQKPLPSWAIESESDDDTGLMHWTLIADGEQVSTWREIDAPGLGSWIAEMLKRFTGAWHLARDSLKLRAGQSNSGKARGASRKQEAKAREARVRNAALEVIAAEGPMKTAALAAILSDRGLGGRRALENRLPAILKLSIQAS